MAYQRSIFIPGLYGQYSMWKNSIVKELDKAETVVQLGNLVGCNDFAKDRNNAGPNEGLLKYVSLYRSTARRWIQIVGDQEIAALNSPDEWTNNFSKQNLRQQWFNEKPLMIVAFADKNRLITHGGLTYGEWLSIGSPDTASEAAKLLNKKYKHSLFQGPCYKLGYGPNYAANPIWCDPLMEYYPSWVTAPVAMPFEQLHGEDSINTTAGRTMLADNRFPIHYADNVSYRNFGSITTIKGMNTTAIAIPLPGKIIPKIPENTSLYMEKFEV